MWAWIWVSMAAATCFPNRGGEAELAFVDEACTPVDMSRPRDGVYVVSTVPAASICCAMRRCSSPNRDTPGVLSRLDASTERYVAVERTLADPLPRSEHDERMGRACSARWLDLRGLPPGAYAMDGIPFWLGPPAPVAPPQAPSTE